MEKELCFYCEVNEAVTKKISKPACMICAKKEIRMIQAPGPEKTEEEAAQHFKDISKMIDGLNRRRNRTN